MPQRDNTRMRHKDQNTAMNPTQMTDYYLFNSERLGFRNWEKEDLDAFADLNADDAVMKHFPKPLTREETAAFIDRLIAHFDQYGYNYFAAEIIETGELIGFIGLAYQMYEAPFLPATDIGWRLKKSAWGKGFATEGARRCLEHAFEELKLEQVVSTCTLSNTGSESIMKKIGMKRMGEFDHPRLKEYLDYEKCVWYEIKNIPSFMTYSLQESERLTYRQATLDDIPRWTAFFVDNDRLRFLGMDLEKSNEELAELWIRKQLGRYATNGFGHLAVELKSNGELIGMGGVVPRVLDGNAEFEIAYSVIPGHWGHGYATEIARTMKEFGMKHIDAPRFISIIDWDNTHSAKVAVKNGMDVRFQTEYLGMKVDIFGVEKS
jgi:RimJ/RimL family protein N-acetyltransferase